MERLTGTFNTGAAPNGGPTKPLYNLGVAEAAIGEQHRSA